VQLVFFWSAFGLFGMLFAALDAAGSHLAQVGEDGEPLQQQTTAADYCSRLLQQTTAVAFHRPSNSHLAQQQAQRGRAAGEILLLLILILL
jgi:hypothetical protein